MSLHININTNNQKIMNANDYANVIKIICTQLGDIKPDDILIRNVTLFCKGLDGPRLKKTYPLVEERFKSIAESYIQSIKPQQDFDYNEYVRKNQKKDKASLQSNETAKKTFEPLTNWLGERMPIVSSKSISLLLDSRLRNISDYSSDRSITDFSFSIVPRLTRADIGDGRIQVRSIPSEITYFKIGKIVIPYNPSHRMRNFTSELTLTFTALRSNGIIAREDTYHFAFSYTPLITNPDLVELKPVNEYCKFSPHLRNIDDMTFRFNDPIYPISFSQDRMRVSEVNYISSDGRLSFDHPHGLETNDIVIVMGLTTHSNASDYNILSQINDPRGIVITKINDNVIATAINFTNITSPDPNSKPWIFFYSKMFRFPLEIGYQESSDI